MKRYQVEVRADSGYIVTIEADHEIEAVELAEEKVKNQMRGAIWVNLESVPLMVNGR